MKLSAGVDPVDVAAVDECDAAADIAAALGCRQCDRDEQEQDPEDEHELEAVHCGSLRRSGADGSAQ